MSWFKPDPPKRTAELGVGCVSFEDEYRHVRRMRDALARLGVSDQSLRTHEDVFADVVNAIADRIEAIESRLRDIAPELR
jgi:hypothetical protein